MIDSLTIKDTHALIADLNKKYRIPEKTAEGILYAMQKAQLPSLGNVATKDDITEAKKELRKEVGNVRKELKEDIKDVKEDIKDVKEDIKDVKEEVGNVRGEVREIKAMLKIFFWIMGSAFSIVFVVLAKLLGIY